MTTTRRSMAEDAVGTPRRRSARIASMSRQREDEPVDEPISEVKKPNKLSKIEESVSSPQTNAAPLGSDHAPGVNKCASFFRRLWTSLLMFAAFCYSIHVGQTALLSLVIIVQFLMYKEVVHLAYKHLLTRDDHSSIPLFRTQNWLWFAATMFFVYGRVAHSVLGWDIPYHTFTSFSLFVSLFVAFVLSLKAGLYRVQFAMFAWVFIALIIIILQSVLLVYNMFNGLFWFVLPAILVMSNDSWAYVWGQLIGKHSLLELSPRKTWEGFIGAFISTCLTAFFVSGVMVQFPILTCPQDVLQIAHPVCDVAPVFLPAVYALPGPVPVLGWTSVSIAPVQIHALFMGIFASIVAPFGGFFASGFKRAFKIKDFGDLIPGHGGLTDRMDCQLLMGVFVYVYYSTFVNPSETTACICAIAADKVNVNSLFDAAKGLSTVDRARLAQMLVGK